MAQDLDTSKDIWKRFDGHGTGSITDAELRVALKEVQAAIPYLQARGNRYTLALNDAVQTEIRLLSYARARGMKVKAA